MEAEPTQDSPYLPATSPLWAKYYQRARELRRLGKGQNARIKLELKRRRRRANLMLLASTATLVAMIAIFYALLGRTSGEPEGHAVTPPAHVV
jgi:hypothetical protein